MRNSKSIYLARMRDVENVSTTLKQFCMTCSINVVTIKVPDDVTSHVKSIGGNLSHAY